MIEVTDYTEGPAVDVTRGRLGPQAGTQKVPADWNGVSNTTTLFDESQDEIDAIEGMRHLSSRALRLDWDDDQSGV